MFYRRAGGAWHPAVLFSRANGSYDDGPQTLRKVAGVWVGDTPLTATVAPTNLAKADAAAAKTTALSAATPHDGTAPFVYAWSKVSGGTITADTPAAASTTFTAAALADGESRTAVFRCKVTDALGHVANSDNVTVTIGRWSQPTLAAPDSVSATGTTASKSTAAVAAVVQYGTAPFTYAWTKQSGGAITADAPAAPSTAFTAATLSAAGETRAAVFRCTVTDAHGLTAFDDVSVSIQRQSSPSLSAPGSSSAQSNTATATTPNVTATAAGGTAPYTYSWARLSGSTAISATAPAAATTKFTDTTLAAGATHSGTWRCTVTDANGLTATADVDLSLSRYSALTAGVSGTTATASAASATVTSPTIAANASGGLSPYSYSWTRVSGSTAISAVSAASAGTGFKSTTVPAGGSQAAVFHCTVTDSLGQVVSTVNVSVTLNNTTVTATYTPAAGTYSATDEGPVSYVVSCSASVIWTWSATYTGTGFTASLASGGSGTSITFTLGSGLHGRVTTITLQSGGKTWTLNLNAQAPPAGTTSRL